MKKRASATILVMGITSALLAAPREARARSGSNLLETIGISIAVGTVLGASTLPFYDQPGSHLENLGYGAAAGAAVGLGVIVAGLFEGSSDDETVGASHSSQRTVTRLSDIARSRTGSGSTASRPITVPSATFWAPLVSLNW